MNTTELELYNASKAGDVSKVKAVLTATPTFDVNKKNPGEVRGLRPTSQFVHSVRMLVFIYLSMYVCKYMYVLPLALQALIIL
jgi:hypothetical protein